MRHSHLPSIPLKEKYRVLIVDDSAVMRGFLTHALQHHKDIILIGAKENGEAALRFMAKNPCDIVLMDIDMPLMDGLTAIPLLLNLDKDIQIIAVSSFTGAAQTPLRALQAGAVDIMTKPMAHQQHRDFENALVEKIRLFGMTVHKKRLMHPVKESPPVKAVTLQQNNTLTRPQIIAIGSSTGGPQALFQLLRPLKNKVTQPIVITQHMPGNFTTLLAYHIETQTGIKTVEASHGMKLEEKTIYVAPGNFHMVFTRRNGNVQIELEKTPPVNFCRPSVDVMLQSLIGLYGAEVLAVILTGLGADGKNACLNLHEHGGGILAQDEKSAVVWGMPGAVAQAGICTHVAPPAILADDIIRIAAL